MNNGKFKIPCDKRSFYRYWLIITQPFHKLRKRPMTILTELLYHYDSLKEYYVDEDDETIWKIVFDYETKLKIRNDLKIEDHIIQNALTVLRKSNIIIDNKIVSKYIPVIKDNKYELNFQFLIDG